MKNLLTVNVSDTCVMYHTDDAGHVELSLYPVGLTPVEPPKGREQLSQIAEIRLRGPETNGGFGAGRTMRFGKEADDFTFKDQQVGDHQITTVLSDKNGLELRHCLSWQGDCPVFAIHTELVNHSDKAVQLDMMTSFILGGLAGYVDGEAFDRLQLHRYRSAWSDEAYPVSESIEELCLERSWGGGLIRAERFGQVGTLPVRGYHPFMALEDTEEGVFWGATLGWTGSWQMELVRFRANTLSMDGGLADQEFGQWSKVIASGETFTSPEAYLACCRGGLDDVCQRLLQAQVQRLNVPAVEEDLPVIFNEWCYSWGNPKESELLKAAELLQGTTVKYLVIDAGWYKEDGCDWSNMQGDWVPNGNLYPDGLAKTVERIRERGLIPGIWFEAEVCGEGSRAFKEESALHLHRGGKPIVSNMRHFMNLQLPEARKKMEDRIIYFLKNNNLGYIKIDYNETIGIGCDDPDSLGEGLRKQVEGTHWFFRRLREVNPDLVIENCASGGHRIEPKMLSLSSMSSFSDAHMEPEIPVIAAHLHNLMLPRQCQIWAVLNPDFSDTKLRYVLGGGMLGRLCLSGGITKLAESQWSIVKEALTFYEKIKGVIKDGFSAIFPAMSPSRRHLRGGLALRRMSLDGQQAVVYFYGFNELPKEMGLELPAGDWTVVDQFGEGETVCESSQVIWRPETPMSCRIVLLKK